MRFRARNVKLGSYALATYSCFSIIPSRIGVASPDVLPVRDSPLWVVIKRRGGTPFLASVTAESAFVFLFGKLSKELKFTQFDRHKSPILFHAFGDLFVELMRESHPRRHLCLFEHRISF